MSDLRADAESRDDDSNDDKNSESDDLSETDDMLAEMGKNPEVVTSIGLPKMSQTWKAVTQYKTMTSS